MARSRGRTTKATSGQKSGCHEFAARNGDEGGANAKSACSGLSRAASARPRFGGNSSCDEKVSFPTRREATVFIEDTVPERRARPPRTRVNQTTGGGPS